jgi:hypothetical protein
MTGLVWFGIIAGLVIVALAVGIPYPAHSQAHAATI